VQKVTMLNNNVAHETAICIYIRETTFSWTNDPSSLQVDGVPVKGLKHMEIGRLIIGPHGLRLLAPHFALPFHASNTPPVVASMCGVQS
jgi:hypothetical protein